MIIDKHKHNINNSEGLSPSFDDMVETVESVSDSPLENVYFAIKRVLGGLHENPNDDSSPLLFRTIKVDHGQFERIVRNKINTEDAVDFPAAFIRFVNVRYLVQQQRVGEGRATLRIRFVLNHLNNSDDSVETDGWRVFEQINVAVQDAKSTEPALNERCNLLYFDMPQTADNGLQAYWVDYEIWFRNSASYQYRNWVERYVVMPPFTNHSDAPQHDSDHHGNHDSPKMDEVSTINEMEIIPDHAS